MTHPENGKPLWTESRVETLLEDFYRKEIPPALRGPSPMPPDRRPLATGQAPPRPQSAKRRANSLAGFAMVGFSSLLMLMLAVMAWNHSGSDSLPAPHSTTTDPSSNGNPGGSFRPENDPLDHSTEGPIEMRSRLQNVTAEDPANAPAEFPELDIEIYPLDREPPRAEPQSPPATAPEVRPMPEENRQLPESTPSQPIDPDEALLETLPLELAFG